MRAGRKPPRAECPVCLEMTPVALDGSFVSHPQGGRYAPGQWYCPGSHEMAPNHIHRCRCGAAWDEHEDAMYEGEGPAYRADVEQ